MKKTASEYYTFLMENANSLERGVKNSKGQIIEFYENPDQEESWEIIAVCHSLKFAADTDFYDTGDMYSGSDYLPVFLEDGTCICEYELYEKNQ